jgi:hypothetical protein
MSVKLSRCQCGWYGKLTAKQLPGGIIRAATCPFCSSQLSTSEPVLDYSELPAPRYRSTTRPRPLVSLSHQPVRAEPITVVSTVSGDYVEPDAWRNENYD